MYKQGYFALSAAARQMLWHYARGAMYTWSGGDTGALGWVRGSHRGVQIMSDLHIGHTIKKLHNQKKFDYRYNTAFDKVVTACGDLSQRSNTWITPKLSAAFDELNRHGYAYSCEAWQGNELVGGLFGVQIGAFVSVDSMFHRAPNAGKAVYGYHMLHLQKCGFHLADTNYASEHCKRFGAVWVPQWQFEQMMRPLLHASIPMFPGQAAPSLPWHLFMELRAARLLDSLNRRLLRPAARIEQSVPAELAEAA
jgi:leucyl/phenylalanyl-tRNA--protein transferase